MVIVFKPGAPEENKAKMRSNLESKGFQINEINGVNMTIFGIIGDTSTLDINMLRIDDAVDKVMRVQEPFKRANRMFHPQDSVINVGGVEIGGRKIQVIAGPCSVETQEQVTDIAKSIKLGGASSFAVALQAPHIAVFLPRLEGGWPGIFKRCKKRKQACRL